MLSSFSVLRSHSDDYQKCHEILGLPAETEWTSLKVEFGINEVGTVTLVLLPTGEQIRDLAELAIQNMQDSCLRPDADEDPKPCVTVECPPAQEVAINTEWQAHAHDFAPGQFAAEAAAFYDESEPDEVRYCENADDHDPHNWTEGETADWLVRCPGRGAGSPIEPLRDR